MSTCHSARLDQLGPLLMGHVVCSEHNRVVPLCLLLAASREVLASPLAARVPVVADPTQPDLPITLPPATQFPGGIDALDRAVRLCDEVQAADEARAAELDRHRREHPVTSPAPDPADEWPLDLARIHRFLLEHKKTRAVDHEGDVWNVCIGCNADESCGDKHAPDCEWVALVEMTRPEDPTP